MRWLVTAKYQDGSERKFYMGYLSDLVKKLEAYDLNFVYEIIIVDSEKHPDND